MHASTFLQSLSPCPSESAAYLVALPHCASKGSRWLALPEVGTVRGPKGLSLSSLWGLLGMVNETGPVVLTSTSLPCPPGLSTYSSGTTGALLQLQQDKHGGLSPSQLSTCRSWTSHHL